MRCFASQFPRSHRSVLVALFVMGVAVGTVSSDAEGIVFSSIQAELRKLIRRLGLAVIVEKAVNLQL